MKMETTFFILLLLLVYMFVLAAAIRFFAFVRECDQAVGSMIRPHSHLPVPQPSKVKKTKDHRRPRLATVPA